MALEAIKLPAWLSEGLSDSVDILRVALQGGRVSLLRGRTIIEASCGTHFRPALSLSL